VPADPSAGSWNYVYTPASGSSEPQSGTVAFSVQASVVFRQNPTTGACEFAIVASGGITSGTYVACGYPPISAGQTDWAPISGILGAHTLNVPRSFNRTEDGFDGEDDLTVTVTLS
jgi:hypothetical protein